MYRIGEMKAAGATEAEISDVRRTKRRLTHGVYVNPGLKPWDEYRLRCRAVLDRLKPGAALAGPSAAAHWGVPFVGAPPERVYVSNVTRGTYGKAVRVLPGVEVIEHEGLLVTPAAPTVARCATLLGSRDALIVADALLATGRCTSAELSDQAAQLRGRPGVERVRWVVRNADGRADSPGETWTRLVVTHMGYDVIPQFHVMHANREAYIDLLVEQTMVALEFDGLVKYRKKGEAEVVYERLREGDLQEMGYRFVRLIWAQLPNHAQLDRRLRVAGATPVRPPRLPAW